MVLCLRAAASHTAAVPVGRSYTCPGVAAWGCDTDVHTLSPLVPVGSTIGLFCPASCNLCGADVDTTSCEPANAPARTTMAGTTTAATSRVMMKRKRYGYDLMRPEDGE